MSNKCRIRFTRRDYDRVVQHLFPGDGDEHGAILLAGLATDNGVVTLTVREVHPARDHVDYVDGTFGYRALSPTFIHKLITRARDQRLVYLAVHNHASDTSVNFSSIDFQSHRRGYPALLQIASGMPVGALVFGRRSIQADLWLCDGTRQQLEYATIVGSTIEHIGPRPIKKNALTRIEYDRQVRMFGKAGQRRLGSCRVGVIGLGGVGSLITELLSRLGVADFVLIDYDVVERSNLSRIVGATSNDVDNRVLKTAVAERVIRQAISEARIRSIASDVAIAPVAALLTSCDYLFLAADSMRARLVVNAIVHQYLIPAAQVGAKIRADKDGALLDAMSANRILRPGGGCLWCNQLIDPNVLAIEAKTDEERKRQAYGTQEPNPSVVTLNAVGAAHAVNDFLFDFLNLRGDVEDVRYTHSHHLNRSTKTVLTRKDDSCPECSVTGHRFARGDGAELPCSWAPEDHSVQKTA